MKCLLEEFHKLELMISFRQTVSSSSASVSDSLQICHTAAKELKANATELTTRLSKLEKDHQELALRMEQATKELAFVSDQLSAAPKLADTPRRLAELQRTVADFGSQVVHHLFLINPIYRFKQKSF